MPPDGPWKENWEYVRDLDEGGQGFTALVRSRTSTAVQAVLKTLRWPKKTQARARMHLEVAALENLTVANVKVPRVLDSNTGHHADPTVPLYFVMEYIPGRTLKQEIDARGPLPLDKAGAITFALADVVSAAHRHRVIHRDLKPDNIMVRNYDDNDLVIVDYGISFNLTDDSAGLTETTEQFGSRFLVLPESRIPGGDRRDARSDLCSVCAILFFCLTGHKPGMLRDSNDRAIHRSPGVSVREVLGGDPRLHQLEQFLDRGLAHDVESRFQSWESLTARLKGVMAQSSNQTVYESPQAAAERIRADLVKTDITTRIHAHERQWATMWGHFQEHIRQTLNTLGTSFDIRFLGSGYLEKSFVPPNLMQAYSPMTMGVIIQPHGFYCEIHYLVAVDGQQFLLMRMFEYAFEDPRRHAAGSYRSREGRRSDTQPVSRTDWENVLYFNPEEWPDKGLVSGQFDRDIVEALDRLALLIKGKHEAKNAA